MGDAIEVFLGRGFLPMVRKYPVNVPKPSSGKLRVKLEKPAYTSMVLSDRNEIIFTDCSIRDYWDDENSLMVDRDLNAALNLKRLGLGIFPSIKRRSGNLSIVDSIDNSTAKEILHTLDRAAKKPTSYLYSG
jgi:hypothetical protein